MPQKKEVPTTPAQVQSSKIEELFNSGIPCSELMFQSTVKDRLQNSEMVLRSTGANKSRVAEIRWTPHGYIVRQHGKYTIIHGANTRYAWVE